MFNSNFVLPSASLTQLCSVKISMTILNSALTNEPGFALFNDNTKDRLLQNIQRMKIPEKFAGYFRNYSIDMLYQVRSWFEQSNFMRDLSTDEELAIDLLNNISWSGRGIINQETTARNWLTYGTLSLDDRYRLACTFHLEHLVRQFWIEVGIDFQSCEDLIAREENVEMVYWSCEMAYKWDKEFFYLCYYKHVQDIIAIEDPNINMKGLIIRVEEALNLTLSLRERAYVYGLMYALLSNNLPSIRYFSKKCNQDQKVAVYKAAVNYGFYFTSYQSTLTFMSTIDQVNLDHLITEDTNLVFELFRCLPSKLVLKMFRSLKSAIGEQSCFNILLAVAQRRINPVADDVFPLAMSWDSIFCQIWIETPESYRIFALNQRGSHDGISLVLHQLFVLGKSESVEMLLQALTKPQLRNVCEDSMNSPVTAVFPFLDMLFHRLATSVDDLKFLKDLDPKEKWRELMGKLQNSLSHQTKATDDQ